MARLFSLMVLQQSSVASNEVQVMSDGSTHVLGGQSSFERSEYTDDDTSHRISLAKVAKIEDAEHPKVSDPSLLANKTETVLLSNEMKQGFCNELLYLIVEKQSDERRHAKYSDSEGHGDTDTKEHAKNYKEIHKLIEGASKPFDSKEQFEEAMHDVSSAINQFPHLFHKDSPYFMSKDIVNDIAMMTGRGFPSSFLQSSDHSNVLSRYLGRPPAGYDTRNFEEMFSSDDFDLSNFQELGASDMDEMREYLHNTGQTRRPDPSSFIELQAHVESEIDSGRSLNVDDFKKWFLEANPGHAEDETPWDMKKMDAKDTFSSQMQETSNISNAFVSLIAQTRAVLNADVGTLEEDYGRMCPDQEREEKAFIERCNAKNKMGATVDSALIFDKGLQKYRDMISGKKVRQETSQSNKYDAFAKDPQTQFFQKVAVWKVGAFYDDVKYLYRGMVSKAKNGTDLLLNEYCGNERVVDELSNLEKVKESMSTSNPGFNQMTEAMNSTTFLNALSERFRKSVFNSSGENSTESVINANPYQLMEQALEMFRSEKSSPGSLLETSDPGAPTPPTGDADLQDAPWKNETALYNEELEEAHRDGISLQQDSSATPLNKDASPACNNCKKPHRGQCNANYWVGRPFIVTNHRHSTGCGLWWWGVHAMQCHWWGRGRWATGFTLSKDHKLISLGGFECLGNAYMNVRCNVAEGRGNIMLGCHRTNSEWQYKIYNRDDAHRGACANESWRVICNRPHVYSWEMNTIVPVDEHWNLNALQMAQQEKIKATSKVADSATALALRAHTELGSAARSGIFSVFEAADPNTEATTGKPSWDAAQTHVLRKVGGDEQYKNWNKAYDWAKDWHNVRIQGKTPGEAIEEAYNWVKEAHRAYSFVFSSSKGKPHRFQLWDDGVKWGWWCYSFMTHQTHATGDWKKDTRYGNIDFEWTTAAKALEDGNDWMMNKQKLLGLVQAMKVKTKADAAKLRNIKTDAEKKYRYLSTVIRIKNAELKDLIRNGVKDIQSDVNSRARGVRTRNDATFNTLKGKLSKFKSKLDTTVKNAFDLVEDVKTNDAAHQQQLVDDTEAFNAKQTELETDFTNESTSNKGRIDTLTASNKAIADGTKNLKRNLEAAQDKSKRMRKSFEDKHNMQADKMQAAIAKMDEHAHQAELSENTADAALQDKIKKQEELLLKSMDDKDAAMKAASKEFNRNIEASDRKMVEDQAKLDAKLSTDTQDALTRLTNQMKTKDERVIQDLVSKMREHDQKFEKKIKEANEKSNTEHALLAKKDEGLEKRQKETGSEISDKIKTFDTDYNEKTKILNDEVGALDTQTNRNIEALTGIMTAKDKEFERSEKDMIDKQANLNQALHETTKEMQTNLSQLTQKNEAVRSIVNRHVNAIANVVQARTVELQSTQDAFQHELHQMDSKTDNVKDAVVTHLKALKHQFEGENNRINSDHKLRDDVMKKATVHIHEEAKDQRAKLLAEYKAKEDKVKNTIGSLDAETISRLTAEIGSRKEQNAHAKAEEEKLKSEIEIEITKLSTEIKEALAAIEKDKTLTSSELKSLRDHASKAEKDLRSEIKGETTQIDGALKRKFDAVRAQFADLLAYNKKMKKEAEKKDTAIEGGLKGDMKSLSARVQGVNNALTTEEKNRAQKIQELRSKALNAARNLIKEIHSTDRTMKSELNAVTNMVHSVESGLKIESADIDHTEDEQAKHLDSEVVTGDTRLAREAGQMGSAVEASRQRLDHTLLKEKQKEGQSEAHFLRELGADHAHLGSRISKVGGEFTAAHAAEEAALAKERHEAKAHDARYAALLKEMEGKSDAEISKLSEEFGKEEHETEAQFQATRAKEGKRASTLQTQLRAKDGQLSSGIRDLDQQVLEMQSRLGNEAGKLQREGQNAASQLLKQTERTKRETGESVSRMKAQIQQKGARIQSELGNISGQSQNETRTLNEMLGAENNFTTHAIKQLGDFVDNKHKEALRHIGAIHKANIAADAALGKRIRTVHEGLLRQIHHREQDVVESEREANKEIFKEMEDVMGESNPGGGVGHAGGPGATSKMAMLENKHHHKKHHNSIINQKTADLFKFDDKNEEFRYHKKFDASDNLFDNLFDGKNSTSLFDNANSTLLFDNANNTLLFDNANSTSLLDNKSIANFDTTDAEAAKIDEFTRSTKNKVNDILKGLNAVQNGASLVQKSEKSKILRREG